MLSAVTLPVHAVSPQFHRLSFIASEFSFELCLRCVRCCWLLYHDAELVLKGECFVHVAYQ
jgi:hypothetical protein